MSPQRRPLNEAARLTQEIIETTGMKKKDVGAILGRNPSLVSQFFTKNKGGSMTEALRTVRDAVQGGERDPEALNALAAPHMTRRRTADGQLARTRGSGTVTTPGGSGRARAGRQHLASGGARLAPPVEQAAARGGNIAFTTRARPSAYADPEDDEYPVYDSFRHTDGTEERRWGNRGRGYSARELQDRIEAAGGDVSAAIHGWMVDEGHLKEDGKLSHVEIRTWN